MPENSTVWGLFYNAKENRAVSAGTEIFKEGEAGAEMYGVVEGEVELRGSSGFQETLRPQSVFGEMALVDDAPRSATAVAKTDATLAVIDRHRFLFLVQESPTFALEVMGVMADRLRRRS